MHAKRRWWETEDERAFTDALRQITIHFVRTLGWTDIPITDQFIHSIAAGRNPGLKWRPQQIERLKAKYISRPEKPAARFELLKRVAKGQSGKDGNPGTPSVYEPTGILKVLEMYPTSIDV